MNNGAFFVFYRKNKCRYQHCILLILFLSVFVMTSCRTVPDFSDGKGEEKGKSWNMSEISRELNGTDPIEPFNRSMMACTDFLMHYLVRPVGYIYGSILPLEVIKRIDYASDNLAFPTRMFSCFLQGQFKGGGVEFLRFLTNSTVGIAGFFDPADAWFGLERRNEDFGQAFGYWNIGPGFYLVLPFTATNNLRDDVGLLFDKAFDAKTYIPYMGYVTTLNSAVNSYDSYDSMTENSYDAYDNAKSIISLMRYAHVENFHHKLQRPEESDFGKADIPEGPFAGNVIRMAAAYGPQNPLVDTLKGAFFQVRKNNAGWWIKTSFWNTDFIPMAETQRVVLSGSSEKNDIKEMEYQIWLNPDKKAPLVVLLPGAGGHYKAGMLRAMAELFHERNCSVAVLASSLNPAFFLPASLGLPGDVKRDTLAVRNALEKVLSHARKTYELAPEKTICAGYSLGGLHTLHLAALEEENGNKLSIDEFIAVNPPADLLYALKKMDSLCRIPEKMTKKEFFEMAGDGAMKLYMIMTGRTAPFALLKPRPKKNSAEVKAVKEGNLEKNSKGTGQKKTAEAVKVSPFYLPLSPEQAGWISGMYMKMGLRELLLAAQQNAPQNAPFLKTEYSWGSRTALYEEIDSYSWYSYAEKLLLPCLQKEEKNLTMEELGKRASLYSISKVLSGNPRVKILHNLDDPLLRKGDILFLDRTLKKRIFWFDCGGHLGNMFLPAFQNVLLQSVPVKQTKNPAEEKTAGKK